ncbi:FAD-dependent oxidoreductase [Aquabacterium sp. A7-Y]|uniref:FAD-dependent oxidoreductase n=1 Tax=Aquabacterium sp. A7-Y TaxID=1349605 RepID=UPI00223D1E8D|nr:FAD-dependent oxidoreductase [Aquabacterium sp. A7-Y]MCW7540854.1 FAD-dependent oxidoreductase [Aquabacterium sp. A7-Y]
MALTRRALLGGAAASLTLVQSGCARRPSQPDFEGGWVGVSVERGHRVRELAKSGALPAPAVRRRAAVLVVGGGIAGLAAARELALSGIDDVQLLELEERSGGNSRGHAMGGMACPLGAHYLPLPGPEAHEVAELLETLGLSQQRAGRTVYDERHLCHSPQERLFHEGRWVEGLLPPAPDGSRTQAQYRRFAALLREASAEAAFSMPTHRSGWSAAHAALDAVSFAHWLQVQGLDDPLLGWYLDYCCRDDYGAGPEVVSAWAGLHYFASRHGFQAPGEAEGEREAVLTWPEGNAWLAERLARPLGERLHAGRTVLSVEEGRHGVEVLAWNEAQQQAEAWSAGRVVMATPLFVAARLLRRGEPALTEAARRQRHAPWLVANLQLDEPLVERPGSVPPAWDSVRQGGDPRALGYVDAMHQSTRPHPGPTVLSAYWALPQAQRAALLDEDWRVWAARVIADLAAVHPDLPYKVKRADLMRYGHAMSIPVPGLRGSAALRALGEARGRVRFAHADLSGYSVFEEAYTWGVQVARRLAGRRH